ncbi:hypothetical protein CRE_23299 [Caenorhabditis remanei]|uniref:SCP domain-containing protein n=1 Tax=Caenorhabditis remanei TaxID=31234 RepID=E3MGL3_CAERE|nr:hypothetical protein CRE_23299 [Caenorhabditis remanei]
MITEPLLLCAISLAIGVLVVSADYTILPLPKEDCDKFVKNLNDKRREMVKRMNISDAYELTWSPELAKEDGEAAGITMLDNENRAYYGGNSFDELSQEFGVQLKGDGGESYDNMQSLLSPIHRTIGCSGYGDTTYFYVSCSLAPGAVHDVPDESLETPYFFQGFKGVPGSKCAAGYENNDGLCALIGSFTTKKPLTKPPVKPSTEAKDKDSVGVTEVTSGSPSISILVAFLLFFVSFTYWF